MARYRDRVQAGRQLAEAVADALLEPAAVAPGESTTAALVLALPRGGVPLAAPVANRFGAELDLVMVGKLSAPGRPELAIGAVAVLGTGEPVTVRNDAVIDRIGLGPEDWARIRREQLDQLAARNTTLRDGRTAPALAGRTVILVDDGLATGATLRAALAAARQERPGRLLVAFPVGSPEACAALASEVELVCPYQPSAFQAVSEAYQDFTQVSDQEVRRLLAEADAGRA